MDSRMVNSKPRPIRFPADVASVAETVQVDFTELVGIFEEQLRSAEAGDETLRTAIFEASKAAERGLKLSNALVEMLNPSAAQN